MFAGLAVRIGLAVVPAACVAAVAGLWSEPTAYAQGDGRDYVDVGLILEVPISHSAKFGHDLDIVVTNDGPMAAYDVEVVVDVVYPTMSDFSDPPDAPVGQVSLDGTRLRWIIPVLRGLQREVLTQRVRTAAAIPDIPFDNSRHPHEFFGEVSTASFEDDRHRGNNTSRAWSYNFRTTNNSFIQVGMDYTVGVSVDNFHPSPGDTVNFTVTAGRRQTHGRVGNPPITPNIPPPIDLKVDIGLTDGLSVAGAPIFRTGGTGLVTRLAPDSATYHDNTFDIGTVEATLEPDFHSMTLPIRLASNATASGQCLTATLTGSPPPGTGRLDDDVSDNAAELCLGYMPVVPRATAQIDVFTIYSCVGDTDPPCNGIDDVRVRAVDKVGSSRFVAPGRALVHVPAHTSREFDGHANSVNGGSEVSWQIPVVWNAESFDAVNTQWSNLRDGFVVSGVGGGAPPGRVHIRAFEGTAYELVYRMGPGTTPPWTGEDTVGYNPGASNGPFSYVAEFEELGTYRVEITVRAKRTTRDGDENCDPNAGSVNQGFCTTETYLFHVGPILNLAVTAAPVAGVATTRNQVAFTVTATNAGPEHAPDARVRVTFPDGLEFVRADREDFDPAAGVWRIGELRHMDYRRSLRQPTGETLTIVAELTGEAAGPVTGSIQNHADYCVRIKSGGTPDDDLACDGGAVPAGYTQHAGPYLDHRPGDNTFSLAPDWRALVRENPPYLTSLAIVSTPTPQTHGPGAYLSGDVIALEARFSKAVYATGSPTLRLRVGDEDRAAGLVGGSGTDVLRFEYTVDRWDRDPDGVSVPANPFRVSGHPIRDGDGNDAMLDFAGLPDDPGHRVDQIGQAQQRPEPGATAGLTATAGDGYVDLRWRAAANSEQVFYQLWRDDDPTWWDIAPRVMGADRGYTVTGLANGSAYVFRVRAHARPEHGGSPGSPSAPVAAVPRSSERANSPPEIDRDSAWNPPTPHCVAAGQSSGEVARVSARDPDGDPVTFYLMGGPWENFSHHFTVDNTGSGDERVGIIRVARAIPRGLNLDSVDVDLEANDGRGGVDQIGVSLQYDSTGGNCQGAGSRSTGSGESGPSLTATVKAWAGNVRNWWAGFWAWADWGDRRLAARPR